MSFRPVLSQDPKSETPAPQNHFPEEVIAFVVGDDGGGEGIDFYAPDRSHAQVFEGEAFGLLDTVLA